MQRRPFAAGLVLLCLPSLAATEEASFVQSIAPIRRAIHRDDLGVFREKGGAFKQPFLTPGRQQYADVVREL